MTYTIPRHPAPRCNDTNETDGTNESLSGRRKRRYRDTKETKETYDSAAVASVCSLQQAVSISLAKRLNKNTLFLFARAVKALEITTGCKIPKEEIPSTFSQWWIAARNKLPTEADFNVYLAKFAYVLNKVKVPLHVDPIEEAERYADEHEPPPDMGNVLGRVALACQRLQQISGNYPFYLSVRTACRIAGVKDKNDGAAFLYELQRRGFMRLVEIGQGKQASRFRLI